MANGDIIPLYELEHPSLCYYGLQAVRIYEFPVVEHITSEDVRFR